MKRLSECCIDRNNNFNLLRLLGASLVIFGHSYVLLGPRPTPDFFQTHFRVISAGQVGVQIFFVISGFLVCQSFVRNPNWVEFLSARMLRIFPALAVALLFTVALGAAMTRLPAKDFLADPRTLDYFVRNLMLDLRWSLPGVFEGNAFPDVVNGSLWTLPKEFALYLILLGVGVLGGFTTRAVGNLACALALALHLQKTGTWWLGGGDINVDGVMFCFMLGVMLFVNREQVVVSFRWGLALLFLTVLLVKADYYRFVAVQFCIAYWVMVIAYHDKLQLPALRRVDYSYGLYIYAFPIQQAIAQAGPTRRLHFYVLLCFLATLPLAMLSWHLVEKPAMRLRDRIHRLNGKWRPWG
ncbi:acyltransferase [Variovorax sp. KK3]|uniref:acyltransferase family protein n=1 Tax=Variovorax sp. KK3 TaxID=1855728 RepID=UPI00097C3455|nr:acyltransferase [Variovorax sp. KK3]